MSVTSTSRIIGSTPGLAPAATAQGQSTVSVALVEVAGQSLGLLASAIERVKAASPVKRLAGAPGLIEGIIELEGEIVPVLDARRRLGIGHREVRPADHFVIVRMHGKRVALHVDAAAGVVEVPAADIHVAAAQRLATFGCAGISRIKGGLFLVHDTDALLTPQEFVILLRALETVQLRNADAAR